MSAIHKQPDRWPHDLAMLLPAQGDWSEADYLWLTDHTNRLVEYHHGYIEVLPIPTDRHQTIMLHLYSLFLAWLRPFGGKVLVAPLRLRFMAGIYREPELLLLRSAADPRRGDVYWEGVDLVLEAVSPHDRRRDLVHKRAEYAAAAIPEYWIVDPEL